MFRHFITNINYQKLIEQQANQAPFGYDKQQSKKKVVAKTKTKSQARVMKRAKFN